MLRPMKESMEEEIEVWGNSHWGPGASQQPQWMSSEADPSSWSLELRSPTVAHALKAALWEIMSQRNPGEPYLAADAQKLWDQL